jgi:ATP phosphoribosyltransferase
VKPVIRVALPSKGRLMERTVALLEGAGYRVGERRRDLFALDPRNGVEFVFLRPVDIPVYVAGGDVDAGVTGEDLVRERAVDLAPSLRLGFGDSRLCLAVPEASPVIDVAGAAGLRVATSFPRLATELLPGPPTIVELAGSVEASVRLGVADAVLDLVETGSTLRAAGLRVVGDPLLHSQACLFVGPHVHANRTGVVAVDELIRRLHGRILGESYVMLEYDVHGDLLADACALTPGVESPTITRLERADWFAVRSMVARVDAHALMSQLAALGAKAIVLTRVENALEIHD